MLQRHSVCLLLLLLSLLPSIVQAHPLFSFWSRLSSSSTSSTPTRTEDSSSDSSGQLVFHNNHKATTRRGWGRTEFDNIYAQRYATNSSPPPHRVVNTTMTAGQPRPEQTLRLRHMLHHGGKRYPQLFRRKDIRTQDRLVSEMLTGESLSHQLRVRTTTTLKPKDQSPRSQGFRLQAEQSIAPGSWTQEVIDSPDVMDKETLIQLAKINYNSYTEVASPGWYDLEGRYSVNSTFGWEEDGVRGHVFASDDNSTLIMAIKGTSAGFLGGGGATAPRDKQNDNLLFSCCCAKVDRTWRAVCDCNTGGYQCDQTCLEQSVNTDDIYYNIATKILWTVQDMYPNANVWLTGHSLGGGLSSLLGLTFGVPTITFEMPGDRLAAQRLHLPGPPAIR